MEYAKPKVGCSEGHLRQDLGYVEVAQRTEQDLRLNLQPGQLQQPGRIVRSKTANFAASQLQMCRVYLRINLVTSHLALLCTQQASCHHEHRLDGTQTPVVVLLWAQQILQDEKKTPTHSSWTMHGRLPTEKRLAPAYRPTSSRKYKDANFLARPLASTKPSAISMFSMMS